MLLAPTKMSMKEAYPKATLVQKFDSNCRSVRLRYDFPPLTNLIYHCILEEWRAIVTYLCLPTWSKWTAHIGLPLWENFTGLWFLIMDPSGELLKLNGYKKIRRP
jgi:hypothetical protein